MSLAKRIQNKNLTAFTRVVVLIALYFVGGLIGKESSFFSGSVALVWPPAGIALAAILLFGYRFWPGVALGAVLFSLTDGTPLGFFTLGTAVGNTMGAVVCAYLLKKFISFDNAMERTRDVTGYIGLACFLGTTVNAAFNVVSLAYGGAVKWDELFTTTPVSYTHLCQLRLDQAHRCPVWHREQRDRFLRVHVRVARRPPQPRATG